MPEPRSPAVAGRFYPGDPTSLHAEVTRFLGSATTPTRAKVLIGPHAGYVYSGAILGQTYAQVEIPHRVILLCPNHTGLGVARSLWAGGAWRMPGGSVAIDDAAVAALSGHGGLQLDLAAHLREHAIEVHLPFLQEQRPDVAIVPVCLARLDKAQCRALGEALAQYVRGADGETLIAVSTDMSHYISADEAKRRDEMALAKVLALDPDGLFDTVTRHGITMCGFIPTTVALHAAKALGATKATLVRYGNSGEASGDYERVVGYAGVVVQ